jgi:hypothetical protein
MDKHKEQNNKLVELAKTFDDFLVVFKANTLPTPDGGRKIDHFGANPINKRATPLFSLLHKALIANSPQGTIVHQDKRDVNIAWIKSLPVGTHFEQGGEGGFTVVMPRDFDDEKQRDIHNQVFRASMGLPHSPPYTTGQVFSAEAVSRLDGAAMMLRQMVGIGDKKEFKWDTKDATAQKNVSDVSIYRKVLLADIVDFQGAFQSSLVPSVRGGSFKLCENVEFLDESIDDLLECKYKMLKSTPDEDMGESLEAITTENTLFASLEGLNNGLRPLLKPPHKFRPGLKFRPGAFVSAACKELIETSIQTSLFYCEKLISDTKIDLASTKQKNEQTISQLIAQGEGSTIEFKETLEYDVKTNKNSKDVLLSALKTIAGFLNFNGGTMLIGVNDSREIKGIERDLSTMKHGNNDRFELKIRNCLKDRFSPQLIGKVKISFEKFTEGIICRVDVPANKDIIHLDGDIYVRDGNTTQKPEGQHRTDWIQQREK